MEETTNHLPQLSQAYSLASHLHSQALVLLDHYSQVVDERDQLRRKVALLEQALDAQHTERRRLEAELAQRAPSTQPLATPANPSLRAEVDALLQEIETCLAQLDT